MGVFLKTFVGSGVFFAIAMAAIFTLLDGWGGGVIYGIIAGTFFGLFMGLFAKYQAHKFRSNPPSFKNEELIKEGPANRLLQDEAVGGWLWLTSKRLIFRSHKLNVQKHDLSIPITAITNASRKSRLGLRNRLHLSLRNGQETFVVYQSGHWVKEIGNLVPPKIARDSSAGS